MLLLQASVTISSVVKVIISFYIRVSFRRFSMNLYTGEVNFVFLAKPICELLQYKFEKN